MSTLLNSHPNILCETEIPEREKLGLQNPVPTFSTMLTGLKNEKLGNIKRVYNIPEFVPGIRNKSLKNLMVWGIDIKYNQFTKKMDSLLAEFKVIHLLRRNIPRKVISSYINNNKKKFKIPAHSLTMIKPSEKFEVDPVKFEKDIKNVRERVCLWTKKFRNRQIPTLTIYYEELCSNKNLEHLDEHMCKKICNFLSVPIFHMNTTLRKTGISHLQDIVINWNDISQFFNNRYYIR